MEPQRGTRGVDPQLAAHRDAFYRQQRLRVSRSDAVAVAGITVFMLVVLREHLLVLPWAIVSLSQVVAGVFAERTLGQLRAADDAPRWATAARKWWIVGSATSWAALPLLVHEAAAGVGGAATLAFFVIFGLSSDAILMPQTDPEGLVLYSAAYASPTIGVLAYHGHWPIVAAIVGILIHVTSASRSITALVEELIHERVEATTEGRAAHIAALTDPLTGSWNRAGIIAELDRLRADPSVEEISVCFIDLDRFKTVNDQFGYRAGDDVLARFAGALRGVLPAGWSGGRFGGDEFVAVGPGGSAREVASAISAIAIPAVRGADGHHVRASVGTNVSTGDEDSLTMLHHAGSAVREAKQTDANTVASSDDELRARLGRRAALERDIPKAVADDEFIAMVQTQVDLRTGEVWGVELLARWHRGDEVVMPGEFVPIISRLGLDDEFDLLMIDKALDLIDSLPRSIAVSVNISTKRLSSESFVAALEQRLVAYPGDASRLTLEVTESDDLVLDRDTLDLIAEVVALGPRLSLDDFGTGFSSITRLVTIPFSEMKLDLSLVRRLKDPETEDLIRTLAGFAERQMLTVVAEGVEHEWQATQLRRMGIPYGQGFLYGRPLPATEFIDGLDLPEVSKTDGPVDLRRAA